MARSSPPEHLAAGQGLYGAVSYTMSGLAAIAAAPLYQLDGPRLLWLTLSGLMLVCVLGIARLTRGDAVTLAPTGPEPAIGA
jgi:hypothetical protein